MRWRKPFLVKENRQLMKERQLARCQNPRLAEVVERNIDAIEQHREDADAAKSAQDHIADAITWFSGSMPFVYFHVVLFAVWIAVNLEIGGLPAFDPYPFGMLTTIVSLEAIFLSTFVLVSQNRQAAIADRRTELDLQINLLTEYELTRVLALVDEIAKKLEVRPCDESELEELKGDVQPEALLEELDQRAANGKGGAKKFHQGMSHQAIRTGSLRRSRRGDETRPNDETPRQVRAERGNSRGAGCRDANPSR
jgi:uncharacterized membrane protein